MTTHRLHLQALPREGRPSFRHLLAAVPVVLAILLTMVFGGSTAATAATATGTAFGHRSAVDGRWLGSWAFDDGTVGFCINLDLPIPPGHSYEYVDGSTLGWFTPDDAARLAYLSRNWGASQDPDEAAAGQLATWMITGLHGQTPEAIAARAGASADRVLALARQMLAAADGPGGASRGATASVHLDRGDDGFDVVRAEVQVDTLSSGPTTLAAGMHSGTITLDGATFEDGEHTATVRNGEGHRIVPDADAAVVLFSASVSFADLPYGAGLTVAMSADPVQSVLVARPISVTAEASVDRTRTTPRPFQPSVVTTTSLATAAPGAELVDQLSVGVQAGPDLASEWGVTGPEGGPYTPIAVTVRSQLLGPFTEAPSEQPEAPLGALVVCEVVTIVDAGPGQYTTPSCVLAEAGYYVWVERIEPGDTPPEGGGAVVLPWRSAFGVASEVTQVVAPPVPPAGDHRLADTGTDEQGLIVLASTAATTLALGAALLLVRRLSGRRATGRAVRGPRRAMALPGSR